MKLLAVLSGLIFGIGVVGTMSYFMTWDSIEVKVAVSVLLAFLLYKVLSKEKY